MDLYNSTAVHNHACCEWFSIIKHLARAWCVLLSVLLQHSKSSLCGINKVCLIKCVDKVWSAAVWTGGSCSLLFFYFFKSHLNICLVALRYNIPDTAVTLCSQRKAAGTQSTAAAAWSLKLHLCQPVSAAVVFVSKQMRHTKSPGFPYVFNVACTIFPGICSCDVAI